MLTIKAAEKILDAEGLGPQERIRELGFTRHGAASASK
jgi:hypothetical protein